MKSDHRVPVLLMLHWRDLTSEFLRKSCSNALIVMNGIQSIFQALAIRSKFLPVSMCDTCGKRPIWIYFLFCFDLKTERFGESRGTGCWNSRLEFGNTGLCRQGIFQVRPVSCTVVYWKFHFETKLNKNDLTERPDLFSNAIRGIFRDGSRIIEDAILRELKTQFRLPNRNYANLEDVISSVRLRCNSSS